MNKFNIFIVALIFLASCSKDNVNSEEQFNRDIKLIEDYLANNNLEAEKTAQGVYYIVDNPGNAEKPSILNIVRCDYKGYLLNGEVFDENKNIEFPLSQVIEGWQIGFPRFGKGGEGRLLIPSRYAYGSRGTGRIAPNTVLIFDIKLHDFR